MKFNPQARPLAAALDGSVATSGPLVSPQARPLAATLLTAQFQPIAAA